MHIGHKHLVDRYDIVPLFPLDGKMASVLLCILFDRVAGWEAASKRKSLSLGGLGVAGCLIVV